MITNVKKRDGRYAPFQTEKIARAIYKAARAAGGDDYETAEVLSVKVAAALERSKNIDRSGSREDGEGLYPVS